MALALFALILFWFLADNILIVSALLFENDVLYQGHFNNEGTPLFLKLLVGLKILAFGLFLYGAYFLIKILLLKQINDYFSSLTSDYLFNAGKLFIASNLIAFLLSFSIFFIDVKYFLYFNGDSRYLSLLMVVFGFFLIIFSKVIQKGNTLKQENDLTI